MNPSIFVIFISIAICNAQYPDKVTDQEWENYKAEFDKTYGDPEVDLAHRNAYAVRKHEILLHNIKYDEGGASYQQGINLFTDKLPKSCGDLCGLIPPSQRGGHRVINRPVQERVEQTIEIPEQEPEPADPTPEQPELYQAPEPQQPIVEQYQEQEPEQDVEQDQQEEIEPVVERFEEVQQPEQPGYQYQQPAQNNNQQQSSYGQEEHQSHDQGASSHGYAYDPPGY